MPRGRIRSRVGSERLLSYMGKNITPEMTKRAVQVLTSRGINVKGYFILGFPTETLAELQESIDLLRELWEIADANPGTFRCSASEFRPYPGTLQSGNGSSPRVAIMKRNCSTMSPLI